MDKTIYIVTQGSYSDYHIVSVFSTRALAEKFIELQPTESHYDKLEIEEYWIDRSKKQIKSGTQMYYITMHRDGTSEVELADFGDEKIDLVKMYRQTEVVLRCRVYAKSEAHAVKIANEKRAQLIASGEWE